MPGAASAGPTMPPGMLMPSASAASAAPGAPGAAGSGIARNQKSGEWIELQLAGDHDAPDRARFDRFKGDSLFLSPGSFATLSEPFGRALPGFHPLRANLYPPDALGRLAGELDTFAKAPATSGESASLARELSAYARDLSGRGKSLWVLGP